MLTNRWDFTLDACQLQPPAFSLALNLKNHTEKARNAGITYSKFYGHNLPDDYKPVFI